MRTRQVGLLASAVCGGVIGIGGAAWACVPGHDHTGPEDTNHAAHAAAQPAPPAPAPAPAPAPVADSSAAMPQSQTTAATSSPPAPATATRTVTARTATTVRNATAPAAVAPANPVVGGSEAQPATAPAPPAGVTPAPEAVAPAVTPTTAFVETVFAEVPKSAERSGSGNILGVLLAGFGVAVLLLAVGGAALRWRRNAGPPALTD